MIGIQTLSGKKRVFISFDYEHDLDLKTMLIGQSKYPDSPFEIADWSIQEHLVGDWKAKVRARIRQVGVVCVLCGEHTDLARGVADELKIAKEEAKEYFLLSGRANKTCKKPTSASSSDRLYEWTWDNLKVLIGGGR